MPDIYGISPECKEKIRLLAKASNTSMVGAIDAVVTGALIDVVKEPEMQKLRDRLTSEELSRVQSLLNI